jgi:hypothetical protein
MSIPTTVERVTVSSGEPLTLPDGTFLRGRLYFTAPDLNIITEDEFVFGGTVIAELVDGEFTVDLVPQDATGIDPTGWSYIIRGEFYNAPDWVQSAQLFKDEPSVVLSDIIEAVPLQPQFTTGFLPTQGGTMTGALVFATGGLNVNAQQAIGSTLSTGIISGGRISASATPNALDIAALRGYIVDTHTNPTNPTAVMVQTNSQTISLDTGSLNRAVSWFLMNSNGTVTQQGIRPTPEQMRTRLVLGVIVYDPGTETIFIALSATNDPTQIANDWADHVDAMGPFRVQGLHPSANGSNLSLDLEAGEIFSRGFQRYSTTTGLLTQNPNRLDVASRTAFSFFRSTRNFTGAEPSVNVVDPTRWDNNGTLTNVGGGSGQATIQRIWMAANGLVGNDIVVQYGQTVHASLSAAIAAVGADPYVIASGVETNAVLVGYVIVTRAATSLADPGTSLVLRSPKFADS